MLEPNLRPVFNITRASHVRLTVRDLARSRDFYTQVLGLIVSDEDERTCYLRALAEGCHHSLVLEQTSDQPACQTIGFRVFFEEELDVAHRYFSDRGLAAAWVQRPFQGRTLQVSDPIGTQIELCATMNVRPRHYLELALQHGGRAQQFDHAQILAPETRGVCDFYAELGFRYSDYIAVGDNLIAAFMYRKGTSLDLAIVHGAGPRLHHVAYIVPEIRDIFTACDAAGEAGYGASVERGPGRHGPGGMAFVYIRDPDGHRVESFVNHYQTIDIETEAVRWDGSSLATNVRWGLPGPERWYFEASEFVGTPPVAPDTPPQPMTLEKYLTGAATQSTKGETP